MTIYVNEDKEIVRKVTNKLKENGWYCPCAIQKNEDTKCMCLDFRTREKPGYCHCGLFYKE